MFRGFATSQEEWDHCAMVVRRNAVKLPPDVDLHGRILRRSVMRAAPQDCLERVWCFGSPGEYDITEPRLLDIVGISNNDKATLFEQVVLGDVLWTAM